MGAGQVVIHIGVEIRIYWIVGVVVAGIVLADEPADYGVVIPGLQIVKLRLSVIILVAVRSRFSVIAIASE